MSEDDYTDPPSPGKDYRCRSVYKNDSDEEIRIRYVRMWGEYISRQEEGGKL